MDTTPESSENSAPVHQVNPLHHLKLEKKQRQAQECANSDWFHLLKYTFTGKDERRQQNNRPSFKRWLYKRENVSCSVAGKKEYLWTSHRNNRKSHLYAVHPQLWKRALYSGQSSLAPLFPLPPPMSVRERQGPQLNKRKMNKLSCLCRNYLKKSLKQATASSLF